MTETFKIKAIDNGVVIYIPNKSHRVIITENDNMRLINPFDLNNINGSLISNIEEVRNV